MGSARITGNHKDVRAGLQRFKRGLQAEMKARAGRVEQEARGMLALGLNATVYGTQPGQVYQRTEALLRGAHAFVEPTRTGLHVHVFNEEPYARYVEYGSYGEGVSVDQAVEVVGTAGASPRPIVTGRSGAEWQTPSLAHSRTLVFSLFRIRQEFQAAVKRLW